jgi:hypothetical protein
MKNTNLDWFNYEKTLTECDILDIAKRIGEKRKEIDDIEAARKKLKELQGDIVSLSRQLEQGKITGNFHGEHTYHDPVENMVTIRPSGQVSWKNNEFTPFTREMTQYEKEKYCQHTIDFKEPEEEEDINLGIQITTENEELQEQEEAILNVDRDQIDVFRSAKDKRYFMFDDFGDRLYLTMERQSQSQIYFHDPAVPTSTILKNKKDIPLVDQSENSQKEPTEETIVDEIPVYKSVKTGEYFLMDNEGERLLLIVASQNSSIINFIDPFDNEEIILKRHEDIRLRDEEPSEPFKEPVFKSPSGQYYYLNDVLSPVPLKVLNSLEEVVFLEEDGKEGVIVRKHTEVIPGNDIE